MCSPTRHAIYTGIYSVKGVASLNHTFVKDGTKSIAHCPESLDYRVLLSGTKHMNPESSFSFKYSGKKNPDLKAIDQSLTGSTRDGTLFCLFACVIFVRLFTGPVWVTSCVLILLVQSFTFSNLIA